MEKGVEIPTVLPRIDVSVKGVQVTVSQFDPRSLSSPVLWSGLGGGHFTCDSK